MIPVAYRVQSDFVQTEMVPLIPFAHGVQPNFVQGEMISITHRVLHASSKILFEMIIRYLKPSETVRFMLTSRQFRPILNSDFLWETLYKTQQYINQYFDDRFSRLIQHMDQNRKHQALLCRRMCDLFTRGCIPWKVKKSTQFPSEKSFPHRQIKVLPNGNFAVSGSLRKISIWTPQFERIATLIIPLGFSPPLKDQDLIPLADGDLMALVSGPTFRRGAVCIWSPEGDLVCKKHVPYITCIAELPDGNFAVGQSLPDYTSLAHEDRVCVYSPNLEHIIASAGLEDYSITRIAALPNKKFVTSCKEGVIFYKTGNTYSMIIWVYHDGMLVRIATLARYNMDIPIRCMAVLPHGNIVAGYDDGAIIWSPDGVRISSCAAKGTEGLDHYVSKIAVLTNGNFATVHFNAVCVWSPEGHLLAVTKCHQNEIFSIVALPDGGFITASVDNTTKIWSPTGIQVATLEGKEKPDNCVAFPNGDILTVSIGGTARIWTMDVKSLMQTKGSDSASCFGCSVS